METVGFCLIRESTIMARRQLEGLRILITGASQGIGLRPG